MPNPIQNQTVSRLAQQWEQQWQRVNSPDHLTMQRPFGQSPVPAGGGVLAPPSQIFGADKLQLNFGSTVRKAPIEMLQQQASASSINRAVDLATGTRNTYNNRVQLLVDGDEAFGKMREMIDSARQSIFLEMFIYHDDETGWDIARRLVEKKKQGVDVKVLLDGLGTVSEKGATIKFLRDNGVDVQIFNKQLFDWENVNITHRKLVLVDGYKGMTGGMNVGDEYAHLWHDLMATIEGEGVQELQREFFIDWTKAGGQMPARIPMIPPGMQFGQSATRVTVTSPNEAGKEKDTKNALISAVHSALHHIYLVNPYFSDPDLIEALTAAAKRGIEVKILLPGVSDNPVHAVLNKQNAEKLMAAGAKVFRVDPGKDEKVFTHAKLMTIDGVWVSMGTTNYDTRALENNQEINISVTDPQFAKTVEDRLFRYNPHALLPMNSKDFGTWERVKAKVYSFFDKAL
ncbi:MAG: phosphatidylserine/phosphatidylglycerophosphate/cardiolipin synthase family protein [Candidatus Sericytochromatia bacterium]